MTKEYSEVLTSILKYHLRMSVSRMGEVARVVTNMELPVDLRNQTDNLANQVELLEIKLTKELERWKKE